MIRIQKTKTLKSDSDTSVMASQHFEALLFFGWFEAAPYVSQYKELPTFCKE